MRAGVIFVSIYCLYCIGASWAILCDYPLIGNYSPPHHLDFLMIDIMVGEFHSLILAGWNLYKACQMTWHSDTTMMGWSVNTNSWNRFTSGIIWAPDQKKGLILNQDNFLSSQKAAWQWVGMWGGPKVTRSRPGKAGRQELLRQTLHHWSKGVTESLLLFLWWENTRKYLIVGHSIQVLPEFKWLDW